MLRMPERTRHMSRDTNLRHTSRPPTPQAPSKTERDRPHRRNERATTSTKLTAINYDVERVVSGAERVPANQVDLDSALELGVDASQDDEGAEEEVDCDYVHKEVEDGDGPRGALGGGFRRGRHDFIGDLGAVSWSCRGRLQCRGRVKVGRRISGDGEEGGGLWPEEGPGWEI